MAVMSATAADFPMTLLSENEADPIHSAIVRKEAWTVDSVRHLRAEAENRVKEGPWTVTSDRPLDPTIDAHEYYSEAPYWWPDTENPGGPYVRKDGQTNPDRFAANKVALNSMCDAVFTLGAAAFLLDDSRYAQRAVRIINTWFVNPKTRMNPDLEYSQTIPGATSGRGSGVIDGRVFIRAIQGMEFLAQTGAWDTKERAAVRKWFEEYLHWLTESKLGLEEKNASNNHASWWIAQVAAVASFVENEPVRKMAFDHYRSIFPRQIRADGSAPREEARTKSLSYSTFNLEAFATTCRIAQVQGVDLWSVRARNVATIATVAEYLEPYLSDPKRWSKEQIAEFQSDGLYSLAFIGMGMKKPDLVSLYRKLERPDGAWLSVVDLMVGRWEAAAHQTRH